MLYMYVLFVTNPALAAKSNKPLLSLYSILNKQGVALMVRKRTGPPCSVGRPIAHAPGRWRNDHPRTRRLAGSITDNRP